MRCPYCGGINIDQAKFCRYCGRSFGPQPLPDQPTSRQPQSRRPPYQPPQRPSYPPPQRPSYPPPQPPQPIAPVQAPPHRQPDTNPPAPPKPPAPQYATGTEARRRQDASAAAAATLISPAPGTPASFPPRSIEQLYALEPGALAYTLVSDEVSSGGKKIVRISYPRCAPWQQIATLLKAFKAYQAKQFNTIVIQGIVDQDHSVYAYTNGQLWFDRHVQLGSQFINRYQIETGTGMESDAFRIVLAEE